jgi:hypothetical protein
MIISPTVLSHHRTYGSRIRRFNLITKCELTDIGLVVILDQTF